MSERKYDNLERMRKEIAKDFKKVEALKEQIREKEEASRVVADVTAMQLSPEQVGAMLDLVKSGQIRLIMNGGAGIKAYATKKAGKVLNAEDDSEGVEQTEENPEEAKEDSEDE